MFVSALGDPAARLKVYVANRPDCQPFDHVEGCVPMSMSDIEFINRECGNGWRKLFNVYAKFLFELGDALADPLVKSTYIEFSQWQILRDKALLTQFCGHQLVFTPPRIVFDEAVCPLDSNEACDVAPVPKAEAVVWHIVMGRTYARELERQKLVPALHWLDTDFAVNPDQRLIVCPYFDYRQLTNAKISRLVGLLKGYAGHRAV